MKKKKESKEEIVEQEEKETILPGFKSPFVLKGKELMVKINGHPIEKPQEKNFKSVKELNELVLENTKILFGQETLLIEGQLAMKAFPCEGLFFDGFLLDCKDAEKPKLYFIQTILAKQNLAELFFQLTAFFAFYRNAENHSRLAQALFEAISKSKMLKKELKERIGKKDVLEFLHETMKRKANILLVMDSFKQELKGIMETYEETWGEMLKPIFIRKYSSNGETIINMEPDFDSIRTTGKKQKIAKGDPVKEDYHFEKAEENVKEVYGKIKTELLKTNSALEFRPQRYYISMRKNKNLAFFHISRKKISMVVMNPEKDTRKKIKHHEIKSLTEKVQKFWNGPSCTIVLENSKNLSEVISLLKKLVAGA
ncbi:MAG: hypothetical protein HY063_05930 [Bacteroidetes bacterium]|nr:hypothetical protein [Bacteroidota bacterium]